MAVIAATVIQAGCGSDKDTESSPARPPDAVVRAYETAIIAGNGKAGCRHLSDEAKNLVEQLAATKFAALGATSCREFMKRSLEGVIDLVKADGADPKEFAKVMQALIGRIGPEHVTMSRDGEKATVAAKFLPQPATLVEQDGEWKITRSTVSKAFSRQSP